MPKLKCEVRNCFYNINRLCTKGAIDVDGPQSMKKRETSCMSFVDRDIESFDYEFAEIERRDDFDGNTEIYCDAVQCVFLQGNLCHADKVEVKVVNEKPHDSDAEKDDASEPHDTMCRTFESKEDTKLYRTH